MKIKINIDVKPREIVSAYVNAPFDKAKQALEEQGYSIISLEENAKLRIQEGKDSEISKNGNWTKEGVIYVRNKGIFLTKKSPIIENPEKATESHRDNKDFYLTDEQVESFLVDSVELTNKAVPTNRFGDDKITRYAFGDCAKAYGDFLRVAGTKEMLIWLADMQDKPFVRQMWLVNLDNRSELNGDSRNLDYSNRVRGVCNSSEGTQKNLGTYSVEEISKVLNDKGITGKLEREIVSGLKQ